MRDSSPSDVASSRRRRSADERRREIIQAATEVVAELGYFNATLTEITRRAGVSKGLLWHYFSDRDDLMQQSVTFLAARLRAGLVADLDVTGPAHEVIRAVFVRTALFTRTHQRDLEAMDQIVHSLRAPDGRRRITMLDYEDIYAEHAALLARGQREGGIRVGDALMFAVGYQSLIDGLIAHLQAHPEADPVAKAHQFADLFLRGVSESQVEEALDDSTRRR